MLILLRFVQFNDLYCTNQKFHPQAIMTGILIYVFFNTNHSFDHYINFLVLSLYDIGLKCQIWTFWYDLSLILPDNRFIHAHIDDH